LFVGGILNRVGKLLLKLTAFTVAANRVQSFCQ
jgi:hypothetical protein